jgi:hypothetical protein
MLFYPILSEWGVPSSRRVSDGAAARSFDWMAALWWVNLFVNPMSPQGDTYQGFAM